MEVSRDLGVDPLLGEQWVVQALQQNKQCRRALVVRTRAKDAGFLAKLDLAAEMFVASGFVAAVDVAGRLMERQTGERSSHHETLAAKHAVHFEDQVIELMEAGEPLDTELDAFAVRRGEIESQIGSVETEIADEESAIDAEMATERADRVTAAEGIDDGLLATYDKIRENTGGVGVARFVGGRCEGCHLSLPAMEVDQIKKQPEDALVTCSSCERILVR